MDGRLGDASLATSAIEPERATETAVEDEQNVTNFRVIHDYSSDFHYDWCVIRLGLPGVLRDVDIDTSYFSGNSPLTLWWKAAAPPTATGKPRSGSWSCRRSACKGEVTI